VTAGADAEGSSAEDSAVVNVPEVGVVADCELVVTWSVVVVVTGVVALLVVVADEVVSFVVV
jgi:hypothetical protein